MQLKHNDGEHLYRVFQCKQELIIFTQVFLHLSISRV